MIDFTKAKVVKGANRKTGSTKQKVSTPIRRTEEEPKVRAKPEMKNFNISMYKQVYCYCEKCNTETVHYLKDERTNCMYCNSGYSFGTHSKNQPVLETPIPYIYDLIYL